MKKHKPSDASIVKRIIDTFGAEIVSNVQPRVLSRKEMLKARARVNRDHPGHEYEFSEDAPVVTCLWPTYLEPSSLSRSILRRSLTLYGIHPEQVSNVWIEGDRLHDGAPLLPADAWRDLITKGIEAANSPHVIVVGSKAMQWVRPDVQIGKVMGYALSWNGKFFLYPIASPLIVQAANRDSVDQWRANLHEITMMILEGGHRFMPVCYQCGVGAQWWDNEGIGWCLDHVNLAKRENARKRWARRVNQGLQERMFDGSN